MAIDDRVVQAALENFEQDDFLTAKELIQGQIRQAKNDFLKSKLELKNDIEKQYVAVEPGDSVKDAVTPEEPGFEEGIPERKTAVKKRIVPRKKV